MKKSFKIILFLFCLCPIVLLTACGSPEKFFILARVSDYTLGSFQGLVEDQYQPEGTSINLIANESPETAETNPFICWVKDNKSVITTEKSLPLTYSAATAGTYTAVFHTSKQEQMRYSSLNKISLENAENYASVEYSISYANITSDSDSLMILEEGKYNLEAEYKTDNKSLLYFGKPGENNEFKILINLKLFTAEGSYFEIPLEYENLLTSSDFDTNGTANITQECNSDMLDASIPITLTFQKLNSSMYK